MGILRSLTIFAVAIGTVAVLGLHPVDASTVASDFEAFALGDVNGQAGWTSGHGSSTCPVYDVAVVSNASGYARFGTKSLRISNAITCGSYNDQTFSPSLVNEAGEASADTSPLSGGTRQTYFEAQWDFASTVPGSEQPGLAVVASADRGDPGRMTWLQMQDTPTGLQLNFEDYQRSVADFVSTPIAIGLDRASPHTVRITIHFIDGPANDVVQVYLDGVLIHTGTTWEDYYRDFEVGVPHGVDSMMFRVAGTAAPATLDHGFLIDNFTASSSGAAQTTAVVVTGPTDVTYATPGAATATGGDGVGAYAFSAGTSTGYSVIGTTVTATAASGACELTATRAADANYSISPASAPFTVTLHKADQSVVTIVGPTGVTSGTTGTATATGGDGTGTYTLSAGTSTGCSVVGNTVSATTATGTCVLTAIRASDANHNASAVSAPFTVTLTAPTPPADDPPPDLAQPPVIPASLLIPVSSTQAVAGLAPEIAAISPTSSVLVATFTTLVPDGAESRFGVATVSIPAGAIPGATSLVLQSVASLAALAELAPLPVEQGQLLTAVSASVFDAAGELRSIDFFAPASLTIVVPSTVAPTNASLGDFRLIYWSGVDWVGVPATVTLTTDGRVQVSADVMHSAIYAVKYVAGGSSHPFVPRTPEFGAIGLALAVFERGSTDDLEIAARDTGAAGVWVQDIGGVFRLLIVDGPSFVKDGFLNAFPTGFAGATAVTLVER